jgi:hypothetical protein
MKQYKKGIEDPFFQKELNDMYAKGHRDAKTMFDLKTKALEYGIKIASIIPQQLQIRYDFMGMVEKIEKYLTINPSPGEYREKENDDRRTTSNEKNNI